MQRKNLEAARRRRCGGGGGGGCGCSGCPTTQLLPKARSSSRCAVPRCLRSARDRSMSSGNRSENEVEYPLCATNQNSSLGERSADRAGGREGDLQDCVQPVEGTGAKGARLSKILPNFIKASFRPLFWFPPSDKPAGFTENRNEKASQRAKRNQPNGVSVEPSSRTAALLSGGPLDPI